MDILGIVNVPMWLIVLTITVVTLYIYGKYPYGLWSRLGVPGPSPAAFVGNSLDMLSPAGCKVVFERWQAQYGRMYGIYDFRLPLLVVTDLEVLKTVLVKDFNNFNDRYFFAKRILINKEIRTGLFFVGSSLWKKLRTLITPTFSSAKLKQLTQHINICAARLTSNIQHSAATGDLFDAKKVYGAFTMDVIASTFYGVEVDSQNNMDEPMVYHGRSLFTYTRFVAIFFLLAGAFPHFMHPLIKLFNSGFFRQEDMLFFDKTISEMIKERKSDPNSDKKVDFLQLMINAEAAEASTDSKPLDANAKKLSRDEIVAQGLLFFVAGYETASTTLQFITYELARHQDVQEKLIEEIDHVVGNEEPTYDHCQSLRYMDAVINETLRLYPPLSQITRLTEEDTTLKGIPVPANTGIMIPLYNISRDPEYFKDPNEFNPQRFLEDNGGDQGAEINALAFMPFGFGPRQCTGMRLALLELKLAMVHVLKRVTFARSVPHEVGISDLASILKPVEPIMIEAKERAVK